MARGLWFPDYPIDWSPLRPNDVPKCILCAQRCKRVCAQAYLDHRDAALRNLERYRQFIRPSGHLDFVYPPARHHQVLQEHLDALIQDDINRLMIFCPPGAAKALDVDTPIATPDGWTTMGQIRPGDFVFGADGCPTRVTAVSPIFMDRTVYDVRTDSGDVIVADEDHLWEVSLCRKPRKTKKKQTHKLGYAVIDTKSLAKRRSKRPMIRAAAALQLPSQDLPLDPYTLGLWLGDGHSNATRITCHDDDKPHYLAKIPFDCTIQKNGFYMRKCRHLFTQLGLINDPRHNTFGRKHIPQQYLRASYAQRLALLQGLIDSDGTVSKRGGSTTFCNTNYELALQVRELVRTMGVKAGWSDATAVLNGKICGRVYRVSFYLKDSASLPRKRKLTRNQQLTPNTYVEAHRNLMHRRPTVCISVEASDHLFLAGESMTPTHNSTYSSVQAVTQWMARNPDKNALCCSNTQDLAEAFNRRRRAVIETQEWQELSGTHLDPNNKGVKEFGLAAGGLSIAAGAGSSITGKRSHFNVADDLIIGHEQANSPTQLDKLWTWWMTDFRSRLVPRCPELVIMTRWSSGDIAGRLLDSKEADTWTVLRMPMECDDPQHDPLGRALGEPLWPEWYEQDKIDEFKRNPRDWVSLFQQRPVDEKGTWCPPEHLHVIPAQDEPKRDTLNIVIGVDIALSIQGGDFTVMAVVGVDADKNLYLIDLYRDQVATDVSARKFLELVQTYRPSRAMIDDDNASKVWHKYVFDLGRQINIAPPLQLRPMRGQDKEVRAAALRGYLLSDQVKLFDRPWTTDVQDEMLNFPSSAAHDDIIDALALVGREMASTSAPSTPVAAKTLDLPAPIIEKDGQRYLNMTLDEVHTRTKDEKLSISGVYRRGWS